MLKVPGVYSSVQHISLFQNRSDEGAYNMFENEALTQKGQKSYWPDKCLWTKLGLILVELIFQTYFTLKI